jgi:hypothetical protein
MTTQKRKRSQNRRSKKYRGGTNSSDSRDADSIILDDLSKELDDLVDPYKKANFWNNVGYGATFVGLVTVIGIIMLKKMKL